MWHNVIIDKTTCDTIEILMGVYAERDVLIFFPLTRQLSFLNTCFCARPLANYLEVDTRVRITLPSRSSQRLGVIRHSHSRIGAVRIKFGLGSCVVEKHWTISVRKPIFDRRCAVSTASYLRHVCITS